MALFVSLVEMGFELGNGVLGCRVFAQSLMASVKMPVFSRFWVAARLAVALEMGLMAWAQGPPY
jgi:hypothetical protein